MLEFIYAKKFHLFPELTNITGPDTYSNSNISVLDFKFYDIDDKAKILRAMLSGGKSPKEMEAEIAAIRAFTSERKRNTPASALEDLLEGPLLLSFCDSLDCEVPSEGNLEVSMQNAEPDAKPAFLVLEDEAIAEPSIHLYPMNL